MSNEISNDAPSVIGIWSEMPLVGPGGMSDWVVVFEPDGKGRVEFWNIEMGNVWMFRWQLLAPRLLRIQGDEYQWLDDDNFIVSEVWSLRKDVSFAIDEGVSALGQPILVLRLIGGWNDEFIPHEFAFCGTNLEEYGEPQWPSSVRRRPS